MSKEVSKKETSLPSTDLAAWGTGPDVSAKDLVVPKLILMQGTSDLVKKKKAQYGDLLDSIDKKILGSSDRAFEVIPYHVNKYYTIRNKNTPKKDFIRKDALTMDTDNLPYFDIEDGMEIIRERTYEIYCVQAGDQEGLPLVIVLKASNEKTGKAVFTQMYIKNRNAKLSPAAVVFEVSSREETRDDNSYMVYDMKPTRRSTKEEEASCLTWFKMVSQIKVDESEEETSTTAQPKEAKKYKSASDLPNSAPTGNPKQVDLNEEIPF